MRRFLLPGCCLFVLFLFPPLIQSRTFNSQIWMPGEAGIYQSVFNTRGEPVIAELRHQTGSKETFTTIVISHISRKKCHQITPQPSVRVNGVDFPIDWACTEIGDDCVEHLTVSEKKYIDLFVDSLRHNLPIIVCSDTVFFPGGFLTALHHDSHDGEVSAS